MFHKVRYTRGVRDILSMGNKPIALDDSIVTTIMSRSDGDGLIELEDEIKSGDEVIVSGSAFSGFVAVFDRRMKDTERVVVLLKTAYQFSVILPESNVIKNVARPVAPVHSTSSR
jgi:transcription antitermination factor NusG